MSNFSVGKIVNISATLILDSGDPKAHNFTKIVNLNQYALDFNIRAQVTVTELPP
eukprot:SAG11_NODE_7225_length_1175_cov_39.176580_3_plen_54_part_01